MSNPESDESFQDRRVADAFVAACDKDCHAMYLLDRRTITHAQLIKDMQTRMAKMEELQKLNSAATTEILSIVTLGKGFFKVLGFIGTLFKPLVALALLGTMLSVWLAKLGVKL